VIGGSVARIVTMYLPFSPAALAWPHDWAIVISWCLLGAILLLMRKK